MQSSGLLVLIRGLWTDWVTPLELLGPSDRGLTVLRED